MSRRVQLPQIAERPDRPGTFRATVEVTRGPDGRRRRRQIDGPSIAVVRERLLVALAAQRDGPIPGQRVTVEQYLEKWLERRDPFSPQQGLKKLRYTTWSNDARKIRTHVVPLIGKRALRDLSGDDVAWMIEQLYAKKLPSGKHLSDTTVGDIRNILVAALNRAVKDRTHGLTYNAAAMTDAIARSTPSADDFYVLDDEQAARFLEAVRGDPFEPVYELALTAALRESEVFGLMWDSVDLTRREVTIRRGLVRVKGKGLMTFAPKTKHSAASLPLTGAAVDLLRSHFRAELEKMLRAGEGWQGGDPRKKQGYVFTTEIGTPISASNFLRRHFYPLCERLGIPAGEQNGGALGLRFHDLRHSCASIMAARHERPEVIQRVMRHASVAFTMKRYVKVFGNDVREAVERRDRVAR